MEGLRGGGKEGQGLNKQLGDKSSHRKELWTQIWRPFVCIDQLAQGMLYEMRHTISKTIFLCLYLMTFIAYLTANGENPNRRNEKDVGEGEEEAAAAAELGCRPCQDRIVESVWYS